jgi:hypothetical protein
VKKLPPLIAALLAASACYLSGYLHGRVSVPIQDVAPLVILHGLTSTNAIEIPTNYTHILITRCSVTSAWDFMTVGEKSASTQPRSEP